MPLFYVHSPVNEHLGRLHVLPTVNSATVDIGAHVCFRFQVLSEYVPHQYHFLIVGLKMLPLSLSHSLKIFTSTIATSV